MQLRGKSKETGGMGEQLSAWGVAYVPAAMTEQSCCCSCGVIDIVLLSILSIYVSFL